MVAKGALFPFTVNHVDGKPMVIESLHHLRTVERDFGVVFSAFTKDNIHDVSETPGVPRFRGGDPDIRHDYRHRYRK